MTCLTSISHEYSGESPDDRGLWPDNRLIAAVRCEPPDVRALDALVQRYGKRLHGRCQLLTFDREAAGDLAQETWLRVLRARRSLDPNANFGGYLMTIATNLWRDRCRTVRRAGTLADHNLASLDADVAEEDGEAIPLVGTIVDPGAGSIEEQALLRVDLDRAFARLAPRIRDVLIARYIDGESAVEIGVRLGRTQQTITTWIRQGVRELRERLAEMTQNRDGQGRRTTVEIGRQRAAESPRSVA